MVNTLFLGDTHLGQDSILTFKDKDGNPLRNFSCIEEHDEFIIENWNKTVRPQDKIYHMGDISNGRTDAASKERLRNILSRLNGHKRLIKGNHDEFPTKFYMEFFEEIYGSRIISNIIFTHIPIHSESLGRFIANVHGHLHCNTLDDKRYLNVSCEQVNFTPISIDEIREILASRNSL